MIVVIWLLASPVEAFAVPDIVDGTPVVKVDGPDAVSSGVALTTDMVVVPVNGTPLTVAVAVIVNDDPVVGVKMLVESPLGQLSARVLFTVSLYVFAISSNVALRPPVELS